MPQLCVVICTHNRASYLQQALESLAQQRLSMKEFEVLVIDNRSIDQTASIAESYIGKLPLKLIYEPTLGLSVARNRGLAECTSEYITYLDDDIIASECLLEEILSGFQTYRPQPALLGGRVFLNWDGDTPAWLPPRYLTLYSMLDYGEHARLLTDKEYLVGANFSARVVFLRGVGGFQSSLGRRGGMLLSGEESQILHKARQAGLPILYQPKALVWHTVTPERKREGWLRKRIFWDGASQPLLDYGHDQPRSFYLRQIAYDLRRMTRFGLNSLMGDGDAVYQLIQRSGRLRTNLLLAMGKIQ